MTTYRRGFEAERLAIRGTLYRAVLEVLGANAVIFPLGDPKHGLLSASTFKTYGDDRFVVTPNEPLADWDTKPGIKGIVPVVTFNGTDEEADTPDTAFFSRDDASSEAFSIGVWAHITDTAAERDLLAKWDDDQAIQEWVFFLDGSDILVFQLRDDSAAVAITRKSDAAPTMAAWVFLVATYDGAGGASAMDTAILYENGAVLASTATNNAGYVAMENGTSTVGLGAKFNGTPAKSAFFNGKMAGGPLGPFFTQTQLTADEVEALYQLGRAAMNL